MSIRRRIGGAGGPTPSARAGWPAAGQFQVKEISFNVAV